MTYANQLNQLAGQVEAAFDSYFGQKLRGKDLIDESMKYSLNAGGKRIRPILLLEVCKAYGGKQEEAMPFAVAIEMIHTYSLIHDDLPCMDDDDLRRGKATNHVVYGYDMAVLAGDGLLNLASEIMTNACLDMKDPQKGLRAMQAILSASGSSGMILGQVADIKFQSDDMMVETLDYINSYKTGKLLTAAILAGGILAGVSSSELAHLESIGQEVGLLFQLVDDLLDIVGNAETLGKRTQMDIQNEKVTYPLLLGIDKTHERIEALQASLMKTIGELSITSTFLIETIQFLVNREY